MNPDVTPQTAELARAALRAAGDATDLRAVEYVQEGSSSIVALTDHTAVRIARDPWHSTDMRRSQRLVDALPDLDFDLPRSRGPAVEIEGRAALPTRRLHGTPHPSGSGDPGPLRDLLRAVREIPLPAGHPDLAQRRLFLGGAHWRRRLEVDVIGVLPEELREESRRRIAAYVDLPEVPTTFTHGDLAGTNVLWDEGRVVGVIDWDLATHEDPAEDTASLAWWHGWDVVTELVDAETAARARVFRDVFPLQMIAFQLVNDRGEEALRTCIARVAPVLAPGA